jgi:hypothetical protein
VAHQPRQHSFVRRDHQPPLLSGSKWPGKRKRTRRDLFVCASEICKRAASGERRRWGCHANAVRSREPIDRPVLLTSLSWLARARNAVVRPYLLDVSSSPLHSRQSLALDVYHFESFSFWVSSSHLWMETERKWMTLTSESFATLFSYFSSIYWCWYSCQ